MEPTKYTRTPEARALKTDCPYKFKFVRNNNESDKRRKKPIVMGNTTTHPTKVRPGILRRTAVAMRERTISSDKRTENPKPPWLE
jgi:hypothetical protein